MAKISCLYADNRYRLGVRHLPFGLADVALFDGLEAVDSKLVRLSRADQAAKRMLHSVRPAYFFLGAEAETL
ncbi:hypothetical protein WJS89_10530 [Sphingomicrobium sp. XHP0235]|uniref:hypothetical protein n=1 Tax=Sphingomicrobium aquimarinum TaxID=3133971 RepID=UPI0031FE501A